MLVYGVLQTVLLEFPNLDGTPSDYKEGLIIDAHFEEACQENLYTVMDNELFVHQCVFAEHMLPNEWDTMPQEGFYGDTNE